LKRASPLFAAALFARKVVNAAQTAANAPRAVAKRATKPAVIVENVALWPWFN